MKNDKELFEKLVEFNKKLYNELDEDASKFSDIMEYFMYKTIKQIEDDNVEDSFIDELESFSNIAEKLEKTNQGQYNLSTFFFVLMQELILKRDNELRETWAKGFKERVLKEIR